MAETARSYSSPRAEALSDLNAYRLPDAVSLVEAVAAGHDDAERCTANDVATRAGYVRWATPLRYLGDKYVPKGWIRERPGGYERLISPDGKQAITLAQGDSHTGTEKMPSTLLERGPLTRQAVHGNRNQLRFSEDVHPAFAAEPIPGTKTWLLLSYYDRPANEIRIELSVPVEFTRSPGEHGQKGHGFITKFAPRIILPTITLAAEAVIEDEPAASEPIDVPVTKRA